MSLFEPPSDERQVSRSAPLAERMRPETLEEFVGQEHILGPHKPLRRQIERGELGSIILWGPPGSGKTTLAVIIARRLRYDFIRFSAVLTGIREVKDVMAAAERSHRHGRRTLVFIDEMHRFNKAQQDAFLPYVERGDIILIGATTENPSFEVISALLSRSKVHRLEPLSVELTVSLLKRALKNTERGLGKLKIEISPKLLEQIAVFAGGDARSAFNTLEVVANTAPRTEGKSEGECIRVTEAVVEDALQRKVLLYDKSGEEHFNLISALHKSVRNSEPDAALYWLGRMLEAGEDPLYVARRLIRMASEDIGLADLRALALSIDAMQAVHFLGMPEGNLALAEATVYLALAPKSNALYAGYGEVQKDVQKTVTEPVPLHLRNAVTDLMSSFDYGKGYQYAHKSEDKLTTMESLPESLRGRRYYQPTDQGLESKLRERMQAIEEWRKRRKETGKKQP